MTATYDQIIQKGIHARQANNRQQALEFFKEAIALAPDQFPAYREAGVECGDLGLFGEAENYYQEALFRRPSDLGTVIHRAICNRRQGNHELCLQQLMDVADKHIKSGHLCNELAISLRELGRLEEAEQWFRRALAESPTNIHILSQFGLLARMAGKRELALTQFESIIQHHPLHIPAYLEAITELLALGRQNEALQKLQLAFVRVQDKSLLEKYLLMLFEQDVRIAVHQLFLHAAYYPISDILIQHLSNYVLTRPQDMLDLNALPKNLVAGLLGQEHFSERVLNLRTGGRFDAFIALLSYFEPVLIEFTTEAHQPLINDKLFLLLILFSRYKKNSVVTRYVLEHINQYIAQFSFSDLCRATASLATITSHSVVLSLFAKAALEQHSVDCLLACLIMRGYYPDECILAAFDDKEALNKLLPKFCEPQNAAVLKNIFTHLLQKELLTIDQVKKLYPDPIFLKSVTGIDAALKPLFQANHLSFTKPEKLRVAVCISGQLRGYKEAFISIKKTLIDPLQPDIFVHTWKDVGFKEPFPNKQASSRVFQGRFLQAYLNLSFIKNYSFQHIKNMLPSVFSLLNKNASVTQEQIKGFYNTDFVIVENDQTQPYASLSNQQKMFYKIDACNELIKTSGNSYDLVIRIRPDKELHAVGNIDWSQIAETCNKGRHIYATCFTGLADFLEVGRYHVGDIVAIGSQATMNYYASVSKLHNLFVEQGLAHFDKVGQRSQSMLGHGLWLGAYAIKDIPFRLGDFLNTSLKAEDILQAINQDLANLDSDVAESLVKALEQDILDQKQF